MIQLDSITLTHFKNYGIRTFSFDKKVVGIAGLNGVGKTNLLDAIYYCCFTKSYFTTTDIANIQHKQKGFRLEAQLHSKDDIHKIVCINRTDAKKEFFADDIPYSRLSEHVGKYPALMIAPDDINMITGASEGRRRFIDQLICQIDAAYLQFLITYNKLIAQRNSLLKSFAEYGQWDATLLQAIDAQIPAPANYIYEKRRDILQELLPYASELYSRLATDKEIAKIDYWSKLHEVNVRTMLEQNLKKDRKAQRTTDGIHRDDLEMQLGGMVFKNIASQGQRKSLLFSLKLAAYEILEKSKGLKPILLLDDVFEKLDEERIEQLLTAVCGEDSGQVFITDTHAQRLQEVLGKLKIDFQLIELQ